MGLFRRKKKPAAKRKTTAKPKSKLKGTKRNQPRSEMLHKVGFVPDVILIGHEKYPGSAHPNLIVGHNPKTKEVAVSMIDHVKHDPATGKVTAQYNQYIKDEHALPINPKRTNLTKPSTLDSTVITRNKKDNRNLTELDVKKPGKKHIDSDVARALTKKVFTTQRDPKRSAANRKKVKGMQAHTGQVRKRT